MAAPTAFIPLFAQIPDIVTSQESQVLGQDYQNSDLVSDVASVLGAEVEQPSTCFAQEEPENIELISSSTPSRSKKQGRRKLKSESQNEETPKEEPTIFHHCLPKRVEMSISEEQKETLNPAVTHGRKQSARVLDAEGQNTIIELVKSVNPYCVFAIKRNQIKIENSRKKMAPFFNGKLRCTFHTCPVIAAVKIWSEARNSIEIMFEGQVTHLSNEVFGLKRPRGTKTKQNRRGVKKPKLETAASKEDGKEDHCGGNGATASFPEQSLHEETGHDCCLKEEIINEGKAPEGEGSSETSQMFYCKLPEWCTAGIPEEKRHTLAPILNPGGYRSFTRDGQNTVVEAVNTINPFCVFAVSRNRVKSEQSRKRNCVFFYGKLRCTFPTCPVKAKIKIRDETCQFVEIQFEGQVTHSSSALFGLSSLQGRKERKRLTFGKGKQEENTVDLSHLLNLSELDKAAISIREESVHAMNEKPSDTDASHNIAETSNQGEILLSNCAEICVQSSWDNRKDSGLEEGNSTENFFPTGQFEDGMFHCSLPCACEVAIPDDRKHLISISTDGARQQLTKEGLNLLLEAVAATNPFCMLTLISYRNCGIFYGKLRCNVPNCPVIANIVIRDESELHVEIRFQGNVRHYSDERLGCRGPLANLQKFKIISMETKREKVTPSKEDNEILHNPTEEDGDASAAEKDNSSEIEAKPSTQVTLTFIESPNSLGTQSKIKSGNQEKMLDLSCSKTPSKKDNKGLSDKAPEGDGGSETSQMFYCKLPVCCTAGIPEEKRHTLVPILNPNGNRSFTRDGQETVIEAVNTINPFCVFAVSRNRVKSETSRKKNSVFFHGKLRCSFPTCPVKVKIKIRDETCQFVDIQFEGQVTHSSSTLFGLKSLQGRKERRRIMLGRGKQEENASELSHLLNLSELEKAAISVQGGNFHVKNEKPTDTDDPHYSAGTSNQGDITLSNYAEICVQSSWDNQKDSGLEEGNLTKNVKKSEPDKSAISVRNDSLHAINEKPTDTDALLISAETSNQVSLEGRFEEGMFHCQLPEKCIIIIPEEKMFLSTFICKDGKKRLTKEGQKIIKETITTINPFCMFSFRRYYIKAEKSRKRNCAFFRAKLACSLQDCQVRAFVFVQKEKSCNHLNIVFEGELIHKSNVRFGELHNHAGGAAAR